MKYKQSKCTTCLWFFLVFVNIFIILEAVAIIFALVKSWKVDTVLSQFKLLFCLFVILYIFTALLGVFGMKKYVGPVIVNGILFTMSRGILLFFGYYAIYSQNDMIDFVKEYFPDSSIYMNYILDTVENYRKIIMICYGALFIDTLLYIGFISLYGYDLKKSIKEKVNANLDNYVAMQIDSLGSLPPPESSAGSVGLIVEDYNN